MKKHKSLFLFLFLFIFCQILGAPAFAEFNVVSDSFEPTQKQSSETKSAFEVETRGEVDELLLEDGDSPEYYSDEPLDLGPGEDGPEPEKKSKISTKDREALQDLASALRTDNRELAFQFEQIAESE